MDSRNMKAVKGFIILGAMLTYAGAVVYGDVMFLRVMSETFMDGWLGMVAMAGAVMVGVSALLLPAAKQFWFSPGSQTIWGYLFWGIDILALGANAILAYQIASGVPLDGIMSGWAKFSPATPLLVVVGWGMAFVLDSSSAMRAAVAESKANMIDEYKKEVGKASKSNETFAILQGGARDTAIDFAEQLASTRIKKNENGQVEVVDEKK